MNTAMIMPWEINEIIANSLPVVTVDKRRSSKDTIAHSIERSRRGVKGLALSWIDLDPSVDNSKIFCPDVDHVNPTQKLICRDIWARYKDWILDTEFTWLVRMVVIFEGAKNMPDFEFVYTGPIKGQKSLALTDKIIEAYRDAHKANDSYKIGHKNKGVYQQTEFTAQIIGI